MERFHERSGERLAEFVDLQRRDGSIVKPRSERLHLHRWTLVPPDESRIGRWRTDMAPADRQTYEEIAGDLLREYGYELEIGVTR